MEKKRKSHFDLKVIEKYFPFKIIPQNIILNGEKSNFRRTCKRFMIKMFKNCAKIEKLLSQKKKQQRSTIRDIHDVPVNPGFQSHDIVWKSQSHNLFSTVVRNKKANQIL